MKKLFFITSLLTILICAPPAQGQKLSALPQTTLVFPTNRFLLYVGSNTDYTISQSNYLRASFAAGASVTLTNRGSNVLISVPGILTGITNTGGGISLVNNSNGPVPVLKSLTNGANVTLTDNGTNISISASGGSTLTNTFNTNEFTLLNGTNVNLWSANGSVSAGTNTITLGIFATALGSNSKAVTNALAAGNGSKALAGTTVALGNFATSSNVNDVAVGNIAVASGGGATAVGAAATAAGANSLAAGTLAASAGADAVALGDGATAGGTEAVALGKSSTSTNTATVAVGSGARAALAGAVAVGKLARAAGANSIAIGGNGPIASGLGSISIGGDSGGAVSSGQESVAIGSAGITASGNNSIAVGVSAVASDLSTTAVGENANATGSRSTALGAGTFAIGVSSLALGDTAEADFDGSTALGNNSFTTANNQVMLGSVASYAQAPTELWVTNRIHQQPGTLAYTGGTNIVVNATNANTFFLTLTNTTFLAQPTGLLAGDTYNIIVTQDGTGGRAVSYQTNTWRFPGGLVPTLTTNANAISLLSAISINSTNFIVTSVINFQ